MNVRTQVIQVRLGPNAHTHIFHLSSQFSSLCIPKIALQSLQEQLTCAQLSVLIQYVFQFTSFSKRPFCQNFPLCFIFYCALIRGNPVMLCSITAQYSKLNDAQILTRLLEVYDQEKVGVTIITSHSDDIIMTGQQN